MSGAHHLFTVTGRPLPIPPKRTPSRNSKVCRLPTKRHDPFAHIDDFRTNAREAPYGGEFHNIPESRRKASQVVVYRAVHLVAKDDANGGDGPKRRGRGKGAHCRKRIMASDGNGSCLSTDPPRSEKGKGSARVGSACAAGSVSSQQRRSSFHSSQSSYAPDTASCAVGRVQNNRSVSEADNEVAHVSVQRGRQGYDTRSIPVSKITSTAASQRRDLDDRASCYSAMGQSVLSTDQQSRNGRLLRQYDDRAPSANDTPLRLDLSGAHVSHADSPPTPRYSIRSPRTMGAEYVDREPIQQRVHRYSESPHRRSSTGLEGTELMAPFPCLQGRMQSVRDRAVRTIRRFIDNQPSSQERELEQMLLEYVGREEELCDALAASYGDSFSMLKSMMESPRNDSNSRRSTEQHFGAREAYGGSPYSASHLGTSGYAVAAVAGADESAFMRRENGESIHTTTLKGSANSPATVIGLGNRNEVVPLPQTAPGAHSTSRHGDASLYSTTNESQTSVATSAPVSVYSTGSAARQL